MCVFFVVGVEVKFRNALYDVLIFASYVPELNNLKVTERGLLVGAAVTLTELNLRLKELVQTYPGKICQLSHIF